MSSSVGIVHHTTSVLDQEVLFDRITINENQPFPYTYGDNVDGYYQGMAMSDDIGGYHHAKNCYLRNVNSTNNGRVLNKSNAHSAALTPFGIEHYFVNRLTETFSILSGERALSMTLEAESPGKLGIIPRFNFSLAQDNIEFIDGQVVLSLNAQALIDDPRYLSIVCSKPYRSVLLESDSLDTNYDPNNIKLWLETDDAETQACFYFVFTKEKPSGLIEKFVNNNKFQQHKDKIYQFLTSNYLWTSDLEYNRALMWSRLASQNFVTREYGAGIWAGLPWFKDCWGRDTFIALSGTCLVNGLFKDAQEIITNFAAMQMKDTTSIHYGRVPNRVTSKTDFIYNTTDGTPWMIREVWEYLNYSGDKDFAREMYPVLQRYIDGVEEHYLDETGLMFHRDPDTWMDAKIDGKIPWSPRGNRANDIQALWFTSLIVVAELAKTLGDRSMAVECLLKARKVKKNFLKLFWDKNDHIMTDHISAQGIASREVRPNQLMTLTVPIHSKLIPDAVAAKVVKNAVNKLLFPWGICSLSQQDINFHPYHDGQCNYHKDAAYHNGTIWGWNAGFTVSALIQCGEQDFAYQLSKNLAHQILHQGHRGTMSENLDAYQHDLSQLIESGTYSQAWSVSEYARNAQQDYLGFKPELMKNRIILSPSLPECWDQFHAILPFSDNDQITISYTQKEQTQCFDIRLKSELDLGLLFSIRDTEKNLWTCKLNLADTKQIQFNKTSAVLLLNGSEVIPMKLTKSAQVDMGELSFATPDFSLSHRSTIDRDYLKTKIESKTVVIATDCEE